MQPTHEIKGFLARISRKCAGKTATNSRPNRYNVPPDLVVFDIG